MNKTAIEWCDYTWNPVTGCKHGCPYCYARKIAERFKGSKAWPQGFEPMFHPERLQDPAKMKKPQTIFVCSMADLFGDWVPEPWIKAIFDQCLKSYQHTYIFLTKRPDNAKRFLDKNMEMELYMEGAPENIWIGTTIENKSALPRLDQLKAINSPSRSSTYHWNLFISFEPLLENIGKINLDGIKQVIIGAQTNPSVEVTPEMVQPIGLATCPGPVPTIKMFNKDSMPSWAMCRRELCWSVHK